MTLTGEQSYQGVGSNAQQDSPGVAMPAQWTTEQVLGLAPDAASAKNGRELATLRKWVSLGSGTLVIWGECQGSGKAPYRTQIDLSEPAFRCSCPSRKFPCKHGLGLFLLLAESPQEFEPKDPPAWVTAWLAARVQSAEKQAKKQAKPLEQAADPAAQAKRTAARQQKLRAGLQELRLWLEDRIRQGLATLPQESYQMWDAVAARMVDAQAPGLARRLRDLASMVHAGTDSHSRLLAQLGQLYLIVEGWEHIESLPLAVQADLRAQIGWNISQEDVSQGPTQTDLWLVVGQRTEVEDRLRIRRTWLFGVGQGTFALLLDFAHGQQPFDHTLLPGSGLEAELVFYPSAYPLRAMIKNRQEAVVLAKQPPVWTEIAAAIAQYSQAFATCPWIEQFPVLLRSVVPRRIPDRWLIQDSQGAVLPLSQRLTPTHSWQLLALSGGEPLTLFGEWDGMELLPLGIWLEDTFYGFR